MSLQNIRKSLLRYLVYKSLAIWYYNHVYAFQYKLRFLKANRHESILFYPHKPFAMHIVYKICHVLGYQITNNPKRKFVAVINYEDATYRKPLKTLNELSETYNIINIRCIDISKKEVDAVFQRVFGYSLMVDPLTYHGSCVKKSNVNAKHDGQIISCPIETVETGFVYQKVINNQINSETVQDIRAPIVKDDIPFVYLKARSLNDRFGNTNLVVKMGKVSNSFTQDEVAKVISFCQEIGLDYGELDILRNKDDGRLYIVDVNNTPVGPPNHLSREQQEIALQTLANAFAHRFLTGSKWVVS